jgi:ferredoxin-type protein NapH
MKSIIQNQYVTLVFTVLFSLALLLVHKPLDAFLFYFLLILIACTILYNENKRVHSTKEIKDTNDNVWNNALQNRSVVAYILAIGLIAFYVVIYWWPARIGYHDSGNTGMVSWMDPVSFLLRGKAADQWFLYGFLYTWFVAVFGFRFVIRYRHNSYQVWRTFSLIFFQIIFAFLLPVFFEKMNKPYHDFKNIWPLNYSFFDASHLNLMSAQGTYGKSVLISGILLIILGIPILTYFFGKRWYCSWVCGCGALAETAGDPFRHLSDKSHFSWKLERAIIYSVLLIIIVMTILMLWTYYFQVDSSIANGVLMFRRVYGFVIGAVVSGVIGVGFYPIFGSRVWCRFACPMAAVLGILQKYFSRFRISVNGGQCISCGNCSTYCEMGIDVRAYAEESQDIVRASCVGCGMCAEVCPRGVLKLENSSPSSRKTQAFVSSEDVTVLFNSGDQTGKYY